MLWKVYDIITLAISKIKDPVSLITDPNALQQVTDLGLTMFKEGPKDFKACFDMAGEGEESVVWIIKHISLTTITTGLIANLLGHGLTIASDLFGILTSFFGHDYYTIGQDTGDLVMQVINWIFRDI